MIVPQANFAAENWNEGTPFRRLGLHTHRKAPAEAQTRFSEDFHPGSFKTNAAGDPETRNITASQDGADNRIARHNSRKAKHNSQNLFNIPTSSPRRQLFLLLLLFANHIYIVEGERCRRAGDENLMASRKERARAPVV